MSRRNFVTPGSGPPRTPLRAHWRRARGRDTGPLCRDLDRARSRAVVGFAAALPLAVVLGSAAGLAILDGESRTAEQEARHRHSVSARTLAEAEPRESPYRGGGGDATAPAVWRFPQAEEHRGTVVVSSGTDAGSTVPLWVDDTGNPAAAPRSDADVALAAAHAGLAVAGGVSLASLGLLKLRLYALDRRADADWAGEWDVVEPRWSGSGR
ncbi:MULTISPECIES: Rv1733c family protein [unclassified Streptomyces]|uniref:Rv1733c family protein n=1 Tax=unclassified Streptomyces TaxID=2593676 RepID=UPI0022B6D7E2|nr:MULTISPECIES: hypothetical protein [unclassified Streptomyces]MCZ7417730.1 hypothetical protein [Streptomyces sp. WMMC897]MCZ7432474.1 hypothetical protein [Streptomyces sp. WMMC1477]